MIIKYTSEVNDYDDFVLQMSDCDVLKIACKNMLFIRHDRHIYGYANAVKGSTSRNHHMDDSVFHALLCKTYRIHMCIYDEWIFNIFMRITPSNSRRPDVKFKNLMRRLSMLKDVNEKYKDGIQLGVELELESDIPYARYRALSCLLDTCLNLFQDTARDISVHGGTEIRFKHPTLDGWKKTPIMNALRALKKKGFKTDGGTAGMHIHMSVQSQEDVWRAANKLENNMEAAQSVLYPICARQAQLKYGGTYRYGLGSNITRGHTRHGTLELRVWQATLNPKVFLARLKFADFFMKFLLSDTPFSGFFDSMSREDKLNYKFLLDTENPHAFGIGRDAALNALKLEA